jgi:glucose/arabinose dehydrogenase
VSAASDTHPWGKIKLVKVASVQQATAMALRPGDPALYVAEQAGRVVAIPRRRKTTTTVLDLRDRVQAGGEQGLLGLTFSGDGSRLYVHYSARDTGDTVLEEYAFANGRVDRASRRLLLTVDQPQSNHNGGALELGPDGMLWLGLGDGGAANDQGTGHAPGGNGQSLDTLLGKLLRIDPRPSGSSPYTIPADNPFARGGGLPEIWAYGLRNPWRFSFDRATGDLWIGDVGQGTWEEIDFAPASTRGRGANYGWNVFEGAHRFRAGNAAGAVPPIAETAHREGNCSITGGYVYRGKALPALRGVYLFTDYCAGAIRGLRQEGGAVVERGRLGVEQQSVAAFGQDGDGELYVLSQENGLYRIASR